MAEYKVLFVTRKFPPVVGGMETLSASVWRVLERRGSATLIANRRGNRRLPLWLPGALVKAARVLLRCRCDVVLAGDAVMFMLLRPLARLAKVPAITMVMGLDLTWDRRGYQWALRRWLPRADRVLAISAATAEVARRLGVPDERVRVVPLGVDGPAVSESDRVAAKEALALRIGVKADRPVLVSIGRLVPRKGVRWLVAEVLPYLAHSPMFVVAGKGPDGEAVIAAAERAGISERVVLLGEVDDATREELLCGGDILVQPNTPVGGDMEGFGLVTIEAALRGTPVMASDLEGLADAVADGMTGWLVAPGDAGAWVAALDRRLADPGALARIGTCVQQEANRRFSLDAFGRRLLAAIDQ